MQPSSSSNNKYTTPKSLSSNDVMWNGPDLGCIGLCTNDTISDVQAKIAIKLCEFMEEFDLSEIDLKCLYDACEICPDPEKNITNVFRLLINSFCELKAKVDALGNSNSGDEGLLEVNMRCLAILDGAGNILNDNTNSSIIQSVIDEVCTHRNQIALLNNKTSSLQQQIDAIPPPVPPILPQVDSACLFTGTRELSIAHDLLDTAFCQTRTTLGLPSIVVTNISKQCPDLTAYLPNPLFVASPR